LVALAAGLALSPFACSSPPAPLGAGAQCFQTSDCEQGLFCVQQPGQASMCSANLALIVSTEEAGAGDAGATPAAADGGDAAPGEGGGAEGSAPPPPQPDGPVDAYVQPPRETGPAPEAQPPPQEAAAPPPEASVQDTGPGGQDSGTADAPVE